MSTPHSGPHDPPPPPADLALAARQEGWRAAPALRLLSRSGDGEALQVLEGIGAMPEQTRLQLRTLLSLCCLAGGASAAGLYLKTDDGWVRLAHSAAQPAALAPLRAITPPALDRPAVEEGRLGIDLLALGAPLLVLALVIEQPLTEQARCLLRQALELACPLVQARLEAYRVRRTRQALLDLQAELAHELRTPLTAVSGFAQLLQRPGLLDERRRMSYAGITVAEAQQATAMIDSMVARLQAEAEALDAPLGMGDPNAAGASSAAV